jgi:PPOX class probable F420-dependent enzyme
MRPVVKEVPVVRLKEREREFLDNPFVGILTEHRPDGSLHTTPVWVDADGRAEVSFNTARGRLKERDIARDPRVSLLVVDPDDPYRWVSIAGRRTSSRKAQTSRSTTSPGSTWARSATRTALPAKSG